MYLPMSTEFPPTNPATSSRRAALRLLSAVLKERRALDEALESEPAFAALGPQDRAYARNLVATALRRLGQIDAVIAACLEKPLPRSATALKDILRLGVAQLLFTRTAPHAAVDETVNLARTEGFGGFSGLVNAILRRLGRDGAAMIAADDAARINTPEWLWASWRAAYGADTCRAIATAHLSEAPLDITAKDRPQDWAEPLGARLLPTGTLRLAEPGPVPSLPGFADGAWWVQDLAAALPARLLGDVAGKTVADLGAAPGGKTAQLAAAGAHVIAVDRSEKRLLRLAENLARLHLSAETVAADAATWRPAARLDAVLLDAPCSATGTIRRHPDVARLKTGADVAKLAALQGRLLEAAVDMVRPGGTIVYCTCSLQPEEGPERISQLLRGGAPAERLAIAANEVGGMAELITDDGDLRTLPCHMNEAGGMDGFYAARLSRR